MLPETKGYVTYEEQLVNEVKALQQKLIDQKEAHKKAYGKLWERYLNTQRRETHNMGLMAVTAAVAIAKAGEQ